MSTNQTGLRIGPSLASSASEIVSLSTTVPTQIWHAPLTTRFTPPPSCRTTDVYFTSSDGAIFIRRDMETTNTACFAPGWTTAPPPLVGFNTWMGSPICPSDQSVASSFVSTAPNTTAACCSSKWQVVPPYDLLVEDPNDSTITLTTWMCVSLFTSSIVTTYQSSFSTTASITISGQGVLASPVDYVFVYDARDLTPPRPTNTTSFSRFITSAPQGPTGSSPSNQGAGLNTGAKAGIGIGVVLCFSLLFGILFWMRLLRRRKARVVPAIETVPELEAKQEPRVEMTGQGLQEVDGHGRQELTGQGLQELSGLPIPVELETDERPVELEGGWI